MGEIKDWILVAYTDAATKKIDHVFSVAGYVVFLVNKRTNCAVPLTWSSKKIERVVSSSLGAETLAMVSHRHYLFHKGDFETNVWLRSR